MNRIQRKSAITIEEAIKEFLRQQHLSAGLNTHKIFSAWDRISGAAPYTIRKFFRDGKLYITVNSSVVRSQLMFQKDALVEKINSTLENDSLFDPGEGNVGYVKELILK